MEPKTNLADLNVVAFAGGVGGAKLALGLQEVLGHGNLSVVVNTADDFEHWGLTICPDIDTVLYNLAGVNNMEQGWGRADETFTAMETMSHIGGEDWFTLGDKDLALHLRRTEWIRQNIRLTEVTDRLRRSLGIPSNILPMSDSPVRTLVHTEDGDLPFQHYFVRCRCEPVVIDLSFVGAPEARPTVEIQEAVAQADLLIFCPSNPFLSIDPILHVHGMRQMLRQAKAPIVAVSPIVGGEAIKGPAAKLMTELGKAVSAITVIDHFEDLLDGFVLDQTDAELQEGITIPVAVTNTLMKSIEIKQELATTVLDFAHTLPKATRVSQSTRWNNETITEIG
ncbi:MAG: 2-phospho-L-lactate transferase [Chloroflexota bacterium]